MNNKNKIVEQFQLDKAQGLLNEVHKVFIDNNLQIVSINKEEKIDEDDLIKLFKVEKIKEPIYSNVENIEDANEIIQKISEEIKKFRVNIAEVLTANENLAQKDVEEALHAISSAISNFDKIFSRQIKRGIDDTLESAEEIRQKLASNLSSILHNRFIKNVIRPLYEGIKFKNCEIYRIIIRKINEFIQNIGVYTINLEQQGEFEYDFVEPQESKDNGTSDYRLDEKIKEIYQYPYVFDLENIVSPGEIVIWRFER